MYKLTALLLPLALYLTACATTPPSRFYVLAPQAEATATDRLPDLLVGMGPVRLVAYLQRPQIVARESDNRLKVEEFDRWGGELETNITWVMAENLSIQLGTQGVVAYPWERAVVPEYQVAVDIRRFDPTDAGTIRLSAQWRILGRDGRELLAIGGSELDEPITGTGFGAQVAAQSRALARLSGEIAARLRGLGGEG